MSEKREVDNSRKKTFILDTNVILHDSECIQHFQEHDIILPITALEELDNFKKGGQTINYHAREFVRNLDELKSDRMLNGGMSLGEGKGKLSIRLERPMHEEVEKNLHGNKNDHRIINLAYHMSKEEDDREIILVSKDVNLRMKARSLGLKAEDYENDYAKDMASVESVSHTMEGVPGDLIEKLHSKENGFAVEEYISRIQPGPNQFFVLRNGKSSGLACTDPSAKFFWRIEKQETYGIMPKNAEQTFASHALSRADLPLVAVTGKAGTGKTLLALAAALESRQKYHQIILSRPVIPLSNKDIGYLPGDIKSKLNPYMQPLHDNLGVIRGNFPEKSEMYQRLHKMQDEGKLSIEPLAYIRGRSLVRMYMIVDEAQNLTPHEVKTIITRAGEGTKIVFTGDVHQIDHPYLNSRSNGLSYLIDRMKNQPIFAHIDLKKGERSPLANLAAELL